MNQASQSEGDDFRIKDALTTFQEFAEKELQQRRDSEEPLDEVTFSEAVALVTHYLKADLEDGDLEEPESDAPIGYADSPRELELLDNSAEVEPAQEADPEADSEASPATLEYKEEAVK